MIVGSFTATAELSIVASEIYAASTNIGTNLSRDT
jgi:hypothetical protein